MPQSASAPPAIVSKALPGSSWWRIGLFGTILCALWLEVVRQLGPEWSFNPQYGYGWSVPFLSLFLLWKRWPERPAPGSPALATLAILAALFCTFLFLPIRFVAEANPDWRLLSWAIALAALVISLCLVYLHGGWPWVRHFAFPFLFFLVAVPWPAHAEQLVIQNLMRAVTAINVIGLNVFGIPALQHGNVIELTSGLIGIEEACSGVRSLQATLMISLFLGELYSFAIARRIVLVLAGAILAFVCNLARTAILVWVGVTSGPNAIHAWHDPAGVTILLACLFGLWGLSLLMQRSTHTEPIAPHHENRSRLVRVHLRLAILIGVGLVLTEAIVQFWYNAHQSPAAKLRWTVRWPTSENAYNTISIPTEAQELLHYSDGGGAGWSGEDGHPWTMYFFRWEPGRTAARFVKIHRPDICLPASGLTMITDHGIRLIKINGNALPVRSYRFDDHGKPIHVFYCYWDARSSYESAESASEEDWTFRGRVRGAIRGQRDIGAQMLEVIVRGYDDDTEANAALLHQLDQMVQTG